MAKLKWTVEFEVEDVWVADGFELTDERALDMLSHDLSSAIIGMELSAKVISAPTPEEIRRLQGYDDDPQLPESIGDDGSMAID